MKIENVCRYIVIMALSLLLSSCLTSEEDVESYSIIIPPGDQVKFATDNFLDYSDDNYSVFVRKVGDTNQSLQTLIDVTPNDDSKLSENKIHTTVVPKGSSLSGYLILEVEMEYHDNHFYGFIFDSETPVRPNLFSSLTYDLLSNYPDRPMESYSKNDILSIQSKIKEIVLERMDLFDLDFKIKMDVLYKFFKNSLASNYDFLTFLNAYNVNFNFDLAGDVSSSPYPFGMINSPPILNEQASTNPGDRYVNETADLKINVLALDPDGDLVFYLWTFNDEFHDVGTTQFNWQPDFTHSRPAPYPASAIISDGGKVLKVDWDINVIDVNQVPELTVNCTNFTATENVEYRCQFSGTDPDNDSLSWQLGSNGFSGTATLNGVAPGVDSPGSTAELVFTPDNADGKKKIVSFEIYLKDGNGGVDIDILQVNINDINTPPVMLGDLTPTNPNHLEPREWDYCLKKDVYGLPDDTGNNGDYTFSIELQDPDNVAGATPKDNIKLKLSGLGTQNIVQLSRVEDNVNNKVTYNYRWRPNDSSRIANINILISDDHGGNAAVITKNLVAKDINQRACMSWGSATTSWVRYLDGVRTKYYRYAHRSVDHDGDISLLVRSDIDIDLLPHQTGYWGNSPIVVKKRFDEAELTYKTKESYKWQGSRTYAKAKYSGLLEFRRSAIGTTDVSVPQGFPLNLVEASTGHFVEFETAQAITIAKDEEIVMVPIIAVNRNVPANHLSVIADPLTDNTITTSHAGFSGEFTYITLTRGPGSTNQDVLIPEDTRITNAPGTTSFEYRVSGDFFMASGVSTVQVPVHVVGNEFPSGSAINHSFSDPSITLSLPVTTRDHIDYTVNPYKGWVEKSFNIHAYDGDITAIGDVVTIVGPLAGGTLMVGNSSSFYEFGEVEFSRPVTDAVSTINIPLGTELRADNGNKYLTTEAATLNSGETTTSVSVKRVLIQSWNRHRFRARLRDYNHRPLLATTNLNILVNEGTSITNFPIEIKDGENPFVAMDPEDRYIFTNVPQSIRPVAPVNFCRNIVNNYAESTNPATCTPCNVRQSGIKYHGSRICYVNFQPAPQDTAENFVLKIEVNDGGYTYPSASNTSTYNMNISILEDNEAPVLTDSSGAPLTGGETISDPIVIAQPFIENVPGIFKINASDGDKTFELKKLGFEVLAVYDVSQGNLEIPTPEGVDVTLLDQVYDESGVGSQTTGGVKWTPTDSDIKKYSGAGGLIFKVKIFDNIFRPTDSLGIERFFKVEVKNLNNIPGFHNLSDTLNPYIDTYYTKTITVVDSDDSTPLFGSFETSLSLCKDKFGAALPHDGINELGAQTSPALDNPAEVNPIHCHAHSSLWGHKFTQFDPNYDGNSGVSECRIPSGGTTVLNNDLAVPKFTRVTGPYDLDGKIAYDYKLEWCPQAGQIDEFGVNIVLSDNGDEDRQSVLLSPKVGTVSLQVNVISPVFFESPKLALQEVPDSDPIEYDLLPDHYMVQTTTRSGSDQFNYPLLINNSKNNPIVVTILESPRDCELENGVCIVGDLDNGNFNLSWAPKYPTDITTDSDPSTWHKIKLKVEDTVTNEQDIVYFYLQVKLPVTNLNRPSIDSKTPNDLNQTISELDLLNLSVNVTDADQPTDPILHYSWFVDGKMVFDRGPSFDYVPDKNQGGIDVDGDGPMVKGQHKVKVVVSDGNFTTEQEWNIQVKNTYLVPYKVFDLVEQRKEVDNVTVTDVKWSVELPFEEVLYGAGGQEFYFNHLLFSGSYKNGVVKKNFMWDLKFFEGEIKRESVGSPWSLYEDLPWSIENKTERLGYYKDGSQLNLLGSSQSSRFGPYLTTQNAAKLSGNLSNISVPLAGGFKCVGTCARNLYLGEKSYGHRLTKKWGNYLFWVDDSGSELKFDFNEGNLLTAASFSDYQGDGSSDTITGMNINENLKRLYISTIDYNNGNSHIHVYDLNPLGTQNDDSGASLPVLIGSANLSLPAPYAAEVAGPTEIIIDEATNTFYTFLSGVGGVLSFVGTNSGMPSIGASSYLGLDEISGSPGDLASSGQKLTFNKTNNLLMGVSRQGNQIFTINPAASNKVSVHSYPQPFNALMTFQQTGLSLVLSRDQAQLFELK